MFSRFRGTEPRYTIHHHPFISYLKNTKSTKSVWAIYIEEKKRLEREYDIALQAFERKRKLLIATCKLCTSKKERKLAALRLQSYSSQFVEDPGRMLTFTLECEKSLSDFEKNYSYELEDITKFYGIVESILFLCGRKMVVGEEKCDCNGQCENCISYRSEGLGFVGTKKITNTPYSKPNYMKSCISKFCGILPKSKICESYVFDIVQGFFRDEYEIFFSHPTTDLCRSSVNSNRSSARWYPTFEDFCENEISIFEIKIVVYILTTIAKKKRVYELTDEYTMNGDDTHDEKWRQYRLSKGTFIGKCKRGLYSVFPSLKRSCKKNKISLPELQIQCFQLFKYSKIGQQGDYNDADVINNFFSRLEKVDKVISYVYYTPLTGKKLFNILPYQSGVNKLFQIQEKSIEKYMKGKRKNSPNVWIRLYFLLRHLSDGDQTTSSTQPVLSKKNFYPITNIHSETCGCKLTKIQTPIEDLIEESWNELGWNFPPREKGEMCFV